MIPAIWREIDWRGLMFLLIGYVIALPFGVYALANVPAPPMQLALGLFVIVTTVMMLRGFRLERTPGAAATTVTGAASGILNGAFGIGGPPVVLFYFSTPAAAAVGRALDHRLLPLDRHAGPWPELARNGLVTQQSFIQFVAWLPALLIGVFAGAKGLQAHGPGQVPPGRALDPGGARGARPRQGRLRPLDRAWSGLSAPNFQLRGVADPPQNAGRGRLQGK